MPLELERPMIVFDLETSGTDKSKDRITQIAALKIWPDGHREQLNTLINPLCEVDPFVLELTHLTQEQLNQAVPFNKWAEYIYWFFTNSEREGHSFLGVDYAGYNIVGFDLEFLSNEFKRAQYTWDYGDSAIVDVFNIYRKKETRTLADAHLLYTGKELSGAHDAMVDVDGTLAVLEGQLEMYDDIPSNPYQLMKYGMKKNAVDLGGKFEWNNGEVVMAFGKHKGDTLKDVVANSSGFLHWMLRNDFAPDAKKIVKDALEGIYPLNEQETK